MALARSTPDAAEAALAEQRANEMMLRHGVHVKPDDADLACEPVPDALGEYWRERLLVIVALAHDCAVVSADKQAAVRGAKGDVVRAMSLYLRLRATLCAGAVEHLARVQPAARSVACGMFLNAAVGAISEKFGRGIKKEKEAEPQFVADAAEKLNMIDRSAEVDRLRQGVVDVAEVYGFGRTSSFVLAFENAGRIFGSQLDVDQRARPQLASASSFLPPRNSYGEVTRLRASLLEID